jgi:hypothetical protein
MIRALLRLAVLAAVIAAAGTVIYAHGTPATIAASRCEITHRNHQPGPDPTCTPGSTRNLDRAHTCHSKERPDLPDATRTRILRDYGVPHWTGHDGELDHRVPFALGGRTTYSNIWTQPGHIPNTKDRLEWAVINAVCDAHTMTPHHARQIFLDDWRTAYRHWQRTGNLP